jgi:L-glyceraldehyde 3-phosphate reductase
MAYSASDTRYDAMTYRRTGHSGLDLPAISLGLWHNFGDDVPFERQRAILRRAFDLGITHFDLANNYGPPYGSAERNFGRHLELDFRPYRDELVLSTKAGWDMWPGPYGQGGGSRKYLLASLDQSLQRMGLDYVDIFYSHRPDPTTPFEETMGALDTAVRSGKALYAGISSYSAADTARAADILADLGTPLLIHQPSYSMLNRWIEKDRLLDTLRRRAPAASPSRRWPRACSPTATCRASRRGRGRARARRCRPTCSATRRSPTSARWTGSRGAGASRWRRWRWPGRCATRG